MYITGTLTSLVHVLVHYWYMYMFITCKIDKFKGGGGREEGKGRGGERKGRVW